jgi:NhaP-type Na+/H+ or K+/H+ antiporter
LFVITIIAVTTSQIVMGAGRVGAAVGGAVAGAVLTLVMVMLVSRLQKRRGDYQNIDEFISPPSV